VKPEVVVACYGMNDGIYWPQSEQRMEAYRQGIGRLIVTVATMAFSISPGWTCRGCQAHRAGGGRPGVAWRA
jgi:hypothetical protein